MKSKLSPRGRKLVLQGSKEQIRATVQIRRGSTAKDLQPLLEELDARALSTGLESGLATVEIRADRLEALAEGSGIDYVDVGGRMTRSRGY